MYLQLFSVFLSALLEFEILFERCEDFRGIDGYYRVRWWRIFSTIQSKNNEQVLIMRWRGKFSNCFGGFLLTILWQVQFFWIIISSWLATFVYTDALQILLKCRNSLNFQYESYPTKIIKKRNNLKKTLLINFKYQNSNE